MYFFPCQTLLFSGKLCNVSQELYCELDPLSDHCVLWKVTCPQNNANLSLFLALWFSATTCPNQSSNFTFRFSPSLSQALPLYLSFISTLAQAYFCHILKKEEQSTQTSSAFKLFQNRTVRVQVKNSSLLLQQRGLMNKTVKTGGSLHPQMEAKRCYSIPVCPQQTLRVQYEE